MQCAPVFPTAKLLLMGNERQKTILFQLYVSRNERQTGRKLSSCHTPQHAKKYALQKKSWRLKPEFNKFLLLMQLNPDYSCILN